jgi:hypothetical protein
MKSNIDLFNQLEQNQELEKDLIEAFEFYVKR